jgi:diguanylate cyclase (GGDEF)-like protein
MGATTLSFMPSASTASRSAPSLPFSGVQRLFAFATVLGLAGAALWLAPLHDMARPSTGVSIPWWAELAACYVGGLLTVEVGARRRFTVSLAEIPVALGLFVVDPWVLLGCYTVGVLLAHWTRRGLRPSRDYGNLMLDIAFVAVAVRVFAVVHPSSGDPLSPQSILALAAAMAVAGGALAPAALVASVALYQGRFAPRDALCELVTQLTGTITSTCVALILLVLTRVDPVLIAAALPPAFLVIAVQQTADNARRRSERTALLHRVSDVLAQPAPFVDRGGELLTAITRAFDVGAAELLLVGTATGAAAVRFLQADRSSGVQESRRELTPAEVAALRLPAESRIATVRADDGADVLSPVAADRGLRSCSLLPVRGHERTVGLLIVQKDRLPKRDVDDLSEAVSLIGVAAEHQELVTVDRRRGSAAEARRSRTGAPLTVCDRPAFMDAVSSALSRATASRRYTAVVLIDLDAFLGIRGAYGESVGQTVLTTIARRLQRHLRRYDIVGRLGHDQLGILLDGLRDRRDAEIVGRRGLKALEQAIELGGDAVTIGASVGIAVADDFDNLPSADEFLRRADMAVYLAKRQPGVRCVVFDSTSRESVITTSSALTR